MLRHLAVRNVGVVADAQLSPSTGFTVITGETGAGKTLLIGGLRLLMGEKTSPGIVGPKADEAAAEGLIGSDSSEVGVTRIVPRVGNSRAHLDGSIVAARVLEEKVSAVLEVVGQHDQLSLRRAGHVVSMIDSTLNGKGRDALLAYQDAWARLTELSKQREHLGGDLRSLRRELDLVEHQASEVESAGLQGGEDELLDAEAGRLRNSREILEQLGSSEELAERLIEDAADVVARLRKVGELDTGAASHVGTAESISSQLIELRTDLRRQRELTVTDPDQLELVESRLTDIGDLKRKYGATIEEVQSFGRDARARAAELTALLESADEIESETRQATSAVEAAGTELRAHRQSRARKIEDAVHKHLSDLGLANAVVSFEFTDIEPGATGTDRVTLKFASDPRLEAGPVESTASGGELSRLVLALRLATAATEVETLVFDEVDTGVGGATALAMGKKIASLAATSQVLCVTHLPQIAAFADTHYVVSREGDSAVVELVAGERRVEEVARMMAGLPESTASVEAAEDLLQRASSE